MTIMRKILLTAASVLFLLSVTALAQVVTTDAASTADENFKLNIVDERYNETDFFRSTNVELRAANGLTVQAGVAVRAANINIFLRGITGDVRFHASLDRIRHPLMDSQPR